MDCDHCGAPVRDGGAFCSHCGGRIKRAVDATPAHRTATAAERFDLVERHPGYARACAHQPRVTVALELGVSVVVIAIGVAFALFTVSMMVGDSFGPAGGGGLASAVYAIWGLVCAGFIGGGVFALNRVLSFARAPILRRVAVVVDERVRVSGGGKNSSASTHYYVSLQVKDGTRTEYDCEGQLAGRIAAPDIGVAFLKGPRLVDFIRFEE
jgi:hypothetical protein